ncbi:hypothetical protein TNCV_2531 [Trichonephila clavipes]|nr:hypothetical protein TNCV_2531 [Trichonephila clavipes]
MASKRKHSTLTLKDKLEVLKRLDKGEGVTKLATEFNVRKASVGDINEWMEEDGETVEFLTDDDIAAAVTQEPMEEEGRTARRNAIRRTWRHMQTAQLPLPCATWSNSPTLHQLMCYL